MGELDSVLAQLPARHGDALRWFIRHAGTVQPWPEPIASGEPKTFLATKAKGIYKPEWSEYALSVRQTLGGPYPDEEPVARSDGTWYYRYFQENADPSKRDDEFTNVGLMACLRDGVPIGVLRQVSAKPHVTYAVLGVAKVAAWDEGLFWLEGYASDGSARPRGPAGEMEELVRRETASALETRAFDPAGAVDARTRVVASIVRRRGQPEFRRRLLEAYERKCAISGCDAIEALEAAHITPYLGPATDHLSNGLLLRADLHTLFDLGLLAVDERSRSVVVAASLLSSSYGELRDRKIRPPANPEATPSEAALKQHRDWAGL